jgi:hypothetical protein
VARDGGHGTSAAMERSTWTSSPSPRCARPECVSLRFSSLSCSRYILQKITE